MDPISKIGPTRMVVIRSGPYDYAEIDFRESCHLVGRNQLGKTSLISSLQFLFISDLDETHFGNHAWAESRAYYLPTDQSYILFECATSAGRLAVVGLRGTGPAGGHKPERFIFSGPYAPEMFISEDRRKVRPFEEIRNRLAAERGYTVLNAAKLRAALLGEAEEGEINLGIVPLADPRQYTRFTRLLKNLLRLYTLSQEDIKQTLVDVYKSDLARVSVNLAKDSADLHAQVAREEDKIRVLRDLAPAIDRLRTASEAERSLKLSLPAMWSHLEGLRTSLVVDLKHDLDRFTGKAAEVRIDEAAARGKIETLDGEKSLLLQEKGGFDKQIAGVEAQHARFADFVDTLVEQSAETLRAQIEQLQGELHGVGGEQPDSIRAKIERQRGELQQLERRRDNHASLLGSHLRKSMPDAAIAELFSVINPALLGLSMPEEARILDDDALKAAIAGLSERFKDGTFDGFGVSIAASALPRADVSGLVDIASLNEKIVSAQKELDRQQKRLIAAEKVSATKEKISGLSKDRDELVGKLAQYRSYKEVVANEPGWRKEAERLGREISDKDSSMAAARRRAQSLFEEAARWDKNTGECRDQLAAMLGDAYRYDSPPGDWPTGAKDPAWPADFKGMLSFYRRAWADWEQASAQTREVLAHIEVATRGEYVGEDEAATIAKVLQAAEDIAEAEKSRDEAWKNLLASVRAAVEGLFADMNTLANRAREFNRRLSGVSVSNLKSLNLEVIENEEFTRKLRPIFDIGTLMETDAVKRLGDFLHSNPEIHLRQMFGVRFNVEMADGKIKHYDDLSVIESTGTNITIKVLIHIMLLKDMMKKGRGFSIPFYLDEADSIDDGNLGAIVRTATDLGFVPVLASPNPRPIARTLYFVSQAGARTVINPRHTLQRKVAADATA